MSLTVFKNIVFEAQTPVNVLNVPLFHIMGLDHFYIGFVSQKVVIFLSQDGLKVFMGCKKDKARDLHTEHRKCSWCLHICACCADWCVSQACSV